jgi:4-diphosphocytidyl-2-C-methyl-D-erythritol kinase
MRPVEDVRAVRVRAPAKLNLHLAIGKRRADGFHELLTVYQAVDLVDEVIARRARELAVLPRGESASSLPQGHDNLAWAAASLLAQHAEVAPHVRLEINKSIPVAGGLAGGSADAAATLVACSELWQLGMPREELAPLAARLGSDVPFALVGGTALGTGRGELLAPVLATGTFHWVLAVGDRGISTADAYRELDRRRAGQPASRLDAGLDPVLDALRAGDATKLAAVLTNDLQSAALTLMPSLRRTLAAGRELGALAGIVSGSGSTCAFLAADRDSAAGLAAALPAEGVCRTTRLATGPAPGARLVR